ncbi:hypothetical protein [Amycolatopsis benzoatilytica]|uniref:hypothetical protein n=1 Tax=Amycolatopsis benzoatilytica TaxID=346045 RepID=UPI0003A8A8F8|nr:hypothetical protein [Amycolatopsis benzoatilytica]
MSHSWAARPPHPVLRGLVTRYVGYAQEDLPLAVHRGRGLRPNATLGAWGAPNATLGA